jgi:hypothetical protein
MPSATRFSPTAPGGGRFDAPGGFGITLASLRQIEDYIQDNRYSIEKAKYGMDTLIRVLINVVQMEARKRSQGPVAPRWRSVPAFAYKIPVQRITGRYYQGWTIRRVRNAHWMLYNDAHEAWLIEYGIYMRVRRPILKQSFMAMLQFIQTTRTGDLFVDWVLAPRRNAKGQFQSFERRIQPFKLMATAADVPNRGSRNPNIVGPTGRLPG